jgi:hypothetical protein
MSLAGGEKERKKDKVLFFVGLDKKTNIKDRRTTLCQVRIPEKTKKKKPRRREWWCL